MRLMDLDGMNVKPMGPQHCQEPCPCKKHSSVRVVFKSLVKLKNITFFGQCGATDLSVELISKIFPENSVKIPLLQQIDQHYHSAELWSLTTNELHLTSKPNSTFCFCNIVVTGRAIKSIFGVRFVTEIPTFFVN